MFSGAPMTHPQTKPQQARKCRSKSAKLWNMKQGNLSRTHPFQLQLPSAPCRLRRLLANRNRKSKDAQPPTKVDTQQVVLPVRALNLSLMQCHADASI